MGAAVNWFGAAVYTVWASPEHIEYNGYVCGDVSRVCLLLISLVVRRKRYVLHNTLPSISAIHVGCLPRWTRVNLAACPSVDFFLQVNAAKVIIIDIADHLSIFRQASRIVECLLRFSWYVRAHVPIRLLLGSSITQEK